MQGMGAGRWMSQAAGSRDGGLPLEGESMTWLEIFIVTAKWMTAIWAGFTAAAILGFAVIGAVVGIGGKITGAERIQEQDLYADLPLAGAEES